MTGPFFLFLAPPPSPQYIRDDGLVETITVDDLAASQRDMVLYLCRDN